MSPDGFSGLHILQKQPLLRIYKPMADALRSVICLLSQNSGYGPAHPLTCFLCSATTTSNPIFWQFLGVANNRLKVCHTSKSARFPI